MKDGESSSDGESGEGFWDWFGDIFGFGSTEESSDGELLSNPLEKISVPDGEFITDIFSFA